MHINYNSLIANKVMNNIIIPSNICSTVVMVGVYYKNNHPGGISAVVQYWSRYFEKLKYYPTFKEGSNIVKVWWFATSYIRIFIRLLFDSKVKIVHCHTAAGSDFKRQSMIVRLAKMFGKKVIIHSHASQFKIYYDESSERNKAAIVKTLSKADVLIALSESWKNWFISLGVASDKITILHNITAYPTVLGDGKNARMIDFTRRPVRFLFMGEIGLRKGVFDIIRGLANHRDEIVGKIELRIGGNKNEQKLISEIKNGGLDNIVSFEGFVTGEKKINLLNWADVYILPSFNEGLPISILEAMSYSLPVISTPVGGIPEVVDTNNGIMVTPGNDEEIYHAMKFYVDNIGEIELQGKESYKKVETYLPDYVMNHLKQIYKSLLI